MEQNEILAGNLLIAEFMGGKLFVPKWETKVGEQWYQIPTGYASTDKNFHVVLPNELIYHSSWEWIMPVVEKIYLNRKVADCIIRPGQTIILLLHPAGDQISSPVKTENSSIIECWLTVVGFIKRYPH